jgi:hypothetical protein
MCLLWSYSSIETFHMDKYRTLQSSWELPCFVFGRPRFDILARKPVILTGIFLCFSQFVQENVGIVQDRFFTRPFQFIIYQSSHLSMLYSLSYWQCHYIVTIYWLYTGFGLVIGFIKLLQLVTTSNCNVLVDSGTLLLTIAHAVFYFFTCHCLVTAPNNALFWSRRCRPAFSRLTHGRQRREQKRTLLRAITRQRLVERWKT